MKFLEQGSPTPITPVKPTTPPVSRKKPLLCTPVSKERKRNLYLNVLLEKDDDIWEFSPDTHARRRLFQDSGFNSSLLVTLNTLQIEMPDLKPKLVIRLKRTPSNIRTAPAAPLPPAKRQLASESRPVPLSMDFISLDGRN